MKCWGYGRSRKIGNGKTDYSETTPQDVKGLASGVVSVAAGGYHTCALTTRGGVKCWGTNYSGELGTGSNSDSSVPVNVSGLNSGVVAIDAGLRHTCALLQSGEVRCWGGNSAGQIGDGTEDNDRPIPVKVTGLQATPSALALGGFHTCALVSSDNLQCWGANWEGQLGNGTTDKSVIPVRVTGLPTNIVGVTAGTRSTCAFMKSGAVKCWGMNSDGQAGDGTTEDRLTPTDVVGLASGVGAVDAGGAHVCAVLDVNGSALKCWGSDSDGQLGIGTAARSYVPVRVVDDVTPEARISYTHGRQGSILTLTGWGYPAGRNISAVANGVSLSPTFTTTDSGAFMVHLNTTQADPGYYSIGVSGTSVAVFSSSLAEVLLYLAEAAPLRRREGGGVPDVVIPSGIAVEAVSTHLPLIQK